jgi:outer membrane lipase/esterase
MKKRAFLVGALFLCLLFPFSTSAFAYSQIVAFGDSLSDNGDADGWGFDRFTDPEGLVWVEYLAQDLGVELFDMAYGGARTDYHPFSKSETLGLRWQIDQYIDMAKSADSDTLYTIWIGGNDLLSLGLVGLAGLSMTLPSVLPTINKQKDLMRSEKSLLQVGQ